MPRKMAKTNRQLIDTAERRRYVIDLRLSGATYIQIAEATEKKFGKERLPNNWSELYAYQDIIRELEKWRREMAHNLEEWLGIELSRLDRMSLALWQRAQQGDVQAIDRILKIMDRRAKLLGLDKPKKVDMSVNLKELSDEELLAIIDGES